MAATEVTSTFAALYKPTVTGLPASTCPVSVPSGNGVAVGDSTGVDVNVGMGVDDSTGVAVGDPPGVDVNVGTGDSTGVEVGDSTGVDVGDPPGVAVNVGTGDSTGVEVGDSPGVDVNVGTGDSAGVGVRVGVGALPRTVRLAAVEGRLVRTLSPLETRTLHSIAV